MVRQAHHDICHPELVEGWQRGARGDFLDKRQLNHEILLNVCGKKPVKPFKVAYILSNEIFLET
jgi:hypothetical protein